MLPKHLALENAAQRRVARHPGWDNVVRGLRGQGYCWELGAAMGCPSRGYCKGAVSPDYNPFQEPQPAAVFLREGHISSLKGPQRVSWAKVVGGEAPGEASVPMGDILPLPLGPSLFISPLLLPWS